MIFLRVKIFAMVISDTHFIAEILAGETKNKCLQSDSDVEKYSLYQHPDAFICA